MPNHDAPFTRTVTPSKDEAEEWLARLRWRRGFVCPQCGGRAATRIVKRRLWQCQRCRHQTSVIAGTALHRCKLPLSTIAYAIWMVGSRKQSISALQLQKDCRIGSYQSAWLLLQRVRQALTESTRPLRGPHVEVSEPIVEHGDGVRPASPLTRQTPVALAIERWRSARGSSTACGRIRMAAHIGDLHVTFDFLARILGNATVRASTGLLARTVTANFAGWLAGTFHGVSDKFMFAYVREYQFRFNRRREERHLPALIASTLLHSAPRSAAALCAPTDLEYPLSAV